MKLSIIELKEFQDYRKAILSRHQYLELARNSEDGLKRIDYFNEIQRLNENKLWSKVATFKTGKLQRLIEDDFDNAIQRFDWVELEVLFILFFRYNLNLERFLPKVGELMVAIVKELASKKLNYESAAYIQLFEYSVEVLIEYPTYQKTDLLALVLELQVPVEFESDFWSVFRKVCHACIITGGAQSKSILLKLSKHSLRSIRKISESALNDFNRSDYF